MGLFSKTAINTGTDSLKITSKYFSLDIPYAKIISAELRTDVDLGRMITGTQGGLTYCGQFKNEEFGMFDVLFHPTALLLLVIRYGDDKTVVVNGRTVEKTKEIHGIISQRMKSE